MRGTMEVFASDYSRIQPGRKYSLGRLIDAAMTNPGLLSSCLFRVQTLIFDRGLVRMASMVRVANNALTGADILPGCIVGPGLLLSHPTGVVIGRGAVIGKDCTVLQNVTVGEKFADGRPPHQYPIIGDRVVIGAGAVVLGNVVIGDNVAIAANSVVISDVTSGSVVAGAPARVVGSVTPFSSSDIDS